MSERLCYAMDAPRGALLVEHATRIKEVKVTPSVVRIVGVDGQHFSFKHGERIRIDEWTDVDLAVAQTDVMLILSRLCADEREPENLHMVNVFGLELPPEVKAHQGVGNFIPRHVLAKFALGREIPEPEES